MNLSKSIFIFLFIHLTFFSSAQTLFSYGSQGVSKEEFLKAFLKNNNQKTFTEKDYRDYLNLYIRFKLRVRAAYEQGLDTLSSQQTELTDFRNQVIDEFVNDQSSLDTLVKEAFDRSQKDIRVAHIFIPFLSSDTTWAWKKTTEACNELKKGTDFKSVAERYSVDTAVKSNQGDLGWITVFTLPYAFENIVYNTPAGKFSSPYRSSLGYHIFKNLGERKSAGKLKTAQILFAFFPDLSETVQKSTRQKADSVYRLLQQGASFADMAGKFSSDKTSAAAGGEIEEFGVGKYEPDFTDAVFALNQPGAYTKPLLTAYGYHIVKLLNRIPVNGDATNRDAIAQLKQQVLVDPRMEVSRRATRKKITNLLGYKKAATDPKKIWLYTDSALQGRKSPGITDQTPLFSLGKQTVTAGDWIKFLQAAGGRAVLGSGNSYADLMDQFTRITLEQYYKDHLEAYNPAFAAQMKEFKDGNLLFEIMQRNIWQKAAADSAGLLAYYTQNKNKYWWEASAEAILFTCKDSATALEVKSKLDKAPNDWRAIILPYGENVQADSGRYELTQLPVRNPATLKANTFSDPFRSASENTAYLFSYVTRIYPERSPRSFDDAKGFVLNDYQTYLEDKWIETLRNKYPVKVNEAVLRSLWK
ncbi:MAG: peptidylprolyl isomerase [Williamsia sp.]|nr:peptidylprolyl isomerase [Williamsia sp.]